MSSLNVQVNFLSEAALFLPVWVFTVQNSNNARQPVCIEGVAAFQDVNLRYSTLFPLFLLLFCSFFALLCSSGEVFVFGASPPTGRISSLYRVQYDD